MHPTIIQSSIHPRSIYLLTSEWRMSSYFDTRFVGALLSSTEYETNRVYLLDMSADAVSMLKAFVTVFQNHLSREFMTVIGPNHEITLIVR
jgi:hypothetical protein